MSVAGSLSDSVVELLLQKGGYRHVRKPLHIADVDFDFDFDAVLAGPSGERALVFVTDVETVPVVAIERRMRALSVVVSRTNASCPVTLVLVGGNVSTDALGRLQEICRVILITPSASVMESLTSLFPLRLPSGSLRDVSALRLLDDALGKDRAEPLIQNLIRASKLGSADVEQAIIMALDRAATVSEEQEGDK
jgi:hypothetical protein